MKKNTECDKEESEISEYEKYESSGSYEDEVTESDD